MRLHADFSLRVTVQADRLPWTASPVPGVQRRMLDRIGDEVARATSLVRYAPGSQFSRHTHDGGEEFLVLEGVFQDEHGDYPVGTYVRNPPGSAHTPASAAGCVIFVKLWQFDPADRHPVVLRPADLVWQADAAVTPTGARRASLHHAPAEQVGLEDWPADLSVRWHWPAGAEILLLQGDLTVDGVALTACAWLRLPAGTDVEAHAGAAGCRFWCKAGHLGTPVQP